MIAPFRAHHVDPRGIARHGWLELHSNSCIPVVAILAAARVLSPDTAAGRWLLADSCLFLAALTGAMTNQVHKWAHLENPSEIVQWMQRNALILSPERHARHHDGDFQQSFCMTTGWLNPLLDRIDFFPRVERWMRALGPVAR